MQFTAQQIAGLLQGELEGNADAVITKLAKIEEGEPGAISFLANPLYTPLFIYHQSFISYHQQGFCSDSPCYCGIITGRKC